MYFSHVKARSVDECWWFSASWQPGTGHDVRRIAPRIVRQTGGKTSSLKGRLLKHGGLRQSRMVFVAFQVLVSMKTWESEVFQVWQDVGQWWFQPLICWWMEHKDALVIIVGPGWLTGPFGVVKGVECLVDIFCNGPSTLEKMHTRIELIWNIHSPWHSLMQTGPWFAQHGGRLNHVDIFWPTMHPSGCTNTWWLTLVPSWTYKTPCKQQIVFWYDGQRWLFRKVEAAKTRLVLTILTATTLTNQTWAKVSRSVTNRGENIKSEVNEKKMAHYALSTFQNTTTPRTQASSS